MPHCLKAIEAIYDRLGVTFDVAARRELLRPDAAGVVADSKPGASPRERGGQVVFIEATKAPFIVRKRDGAFTYATTDLATIRYRRTTWNPDQILYVVDHRQGDHFKLLFAVARRWGYAEVDLQHVAFGTVWAGPAAVQDP